MIDKIEQIKLIDFVSTRITSVTELNLVQLMLWIIKVYKTYTAPEVILNGKTSQISDQFSLGVIVYEIFASQLPCQEKLDKNLTTQKLFKLSYYESIIMHNLNLSIWIDGTVCKTCYLDAASRYKV